MVDLLLSVRGNTGAASPPLPSHSEGIRGKVDPERVETTEVEGRGAAEAETDDQEHTLYLTDQKNIVYIFKIKILRFVDILAKMCLNSSYLDYFFKTSVRLNGEQMLKSQVHF